MVVRTVGSFHKLISSGQLSVVFLLLFWGWTSEWICFVLCWSLEVRGSLVSATHNTYSSPGTELPRRRTEIALPCHQKLHESLFLWYFDHFCPLQLYVFIPSFRFSLTPSSLLLLVITLSLSAPGFTSCLRSRY